MNLNEPNWSELISEQRASGQTIDEFCAHRGVNKYTFKKRKYGHSKTLQLGGADFIEVRQRASSNLNIKLKNGRTLEISSGFNESDVQRLIRLLESC